MPKVYFTTTTTPILHRAGNVVPDDTQSIDLGQSDLYNKKQRHVDSLDQFSESTKPIRLQPGSDSAAKHRQSSRRQHTQKHVGPKSHFTRFHESPTIQQESSYNVPVNHSRNIEYEDSSDSSGSNSDVEDPAFPYAGGPGHRQASPQTLSIMWHAMNRAGVRSFQPDLLDSFNSPDNQFLWGLAILLFIKLVKAHEYTDVDLEMHSEQKIYQTFYSHAKHLCQRFPLENADPHKKNCKAKYSRCMTCLENNRKARIAYLLTQPELMPLIPIVQKCTSDDKTDHGATDESDRKENDDQHIHKRFSILHMQWCHPRIRKMMRMIDELIACKKNVHGSKCASKNQRIESRPQKISFVNCPSGLPSDCYNGEWLQTQSVPKVISLQIQPGTSIKQFINIMNAMH
ncbi:hypothetical protein O181_025165 [Austropuccinia psidii MF-1]|uniref:Uncharacterized protein n=1 Tax=Austropuccinia psidii MF-1 TaxID=1389203 RepID=A0A9Q3CLX5_9BASI|nr:hypothetical protein [Austropuccinia psidii MF-1]